MAETDASARHVYAMIELEKKKEKKKKKKKSLTRRQSACTSHDGLAVVIALSPTLSIGSAGIIK